MSCVLNVTERRDKVSAREEGTRSRESRAETLRGESICSVNTPPLLSLCVSVYLTRVYVCLNMTCNQFMLCLTYTVYLFLEISVNI